MTYDEIINIGIKKICGILKSNEVPNATYFIYNGYLMIVLYSTIVYFYNLGIQTDPSSSIEFKLVLNPDTKEWIVIDYKKYNNFTINPLRDIFNNYFYVPERNQIIAEANDLQNDPEFAKLLALKSSEGMKFYKLPNIELYKITYLPIFTGFPAMIKGDTISVKVYKDIYDCYSIVEYTLYKTKIKDYTKLYFRVLNL